MTEMKIIALDIDDVLCRFTPHVHKYFNKELEKLDYWCPIVMNGKFGEGWFLGHIAPDEEFWATVPVLSLPEEIDFEFDYYISSFPREMYDVRMKWLKENKFPDKPLICSSNKLETCKELGVNVLVDDKAETIHHLLKNDILGIHFINEYAGFKPVGDFITNLNQVKYRI